MSVTRVRYANDSGANSFYVVVATSPFTLQQADRYVIVQAPATITFLLPPSPVAGERHTFVDDSGNLSSTLKAVVSGNGKSINAPYPGPSTYEMYLPRRANTFQYNGTQWDVLETSGPVKISEGAATSTRYTWPLLHGVMSTTGNPLVVGSNLFDPAIAIVRKADPEWTVTVAFKAIMGSTNALNTAKIELVDVDNVLGNGAGVVVPGSLLSTTSSGQYLSANISAMTVNTTTGTFQARISLSPSAIVDVAICYMAKIDVEYTLFAP